MSDDTVNRPLRVAPSVVEKWVREARIRFSVLSGIGDVLHPISALVAIMHRMDYKPKFEHLANQDRLMTIPVGKSIAEEYGYLRIVERHLSKEMLEDLLAEIELAETDSRVEVLTMHDSNGQLVEGSVFVSENGQLSYTSHGDGELDTSKDRGEDWGAW